MGRRPILRQGWGKQYRRKPVLNSRLGGIFTGILNSYGASHSLVKLPCKSQFGVEELGQEDGERN